MTTTFNHAQIAPLIQQLEEAKTKSKTEERAALKLKLRNKLQEQSRHEKNQFSWHSSASMRRGGESRRMGESPWMDTSGNDALMVAARRGLIREHIAKVAIMKQMEMEDIPTFADVWQNYLERKSPNHSHETHTTTGSCGCGSSH
jgi:hypothetical protein